MDIKKYIKEVPNFPKEGILYRDIQPLLADPKAFYNAIVGLGDLINMEEVDYFVGIESRGFIFASALALSNLKGFKMIRKAGKLPDSNEALYGVEYELEYGSAIIEMQSGTGKVVIVDDVFATGGTMAAAKHLANRAGYEVVDTISLLDIGIIKNHDIKCLISY